MNFDQLNCTFVFSISPGLYNLLEIVTLIIIYNYLIFLLIFNYQIIHF